MPPHTTKEPRTNRNSPNGHREFRSLFSNNRARPSVRTFRLRHPRGPKLNSKIAVYCVHPPKPPFASNLHLRAYLGKCSKTFWLSWREKKKITEIGKTFFLESQKIITKKLKKKNRIRTKTENSFKGGKRKNWEKTHTRPKERPQRESDKGAPDEGKICQLTCRKPKDNPQRNVGADCAGATDLLAGASFPRITSLFTPSTLLSTWVVSLYVFPLSTSKTILKIRVSEIN